MKSKFMLFKEDISTIELPKKFTFPFYYEPHKLCLIASNELQEYLETQVDIDHNFGLIKHQKGLVIGKMFGVLVCQNNKGQMGQLWAFSGKLADSNHHNKFVPPVYDMLQKQSFYKQNESELNELTIQIQIIEQSISYKNATENLANTKAKALLDIENQKNKIKHNKIIRAKMRTSQNCDVEKLNNESQQEGILLKKMNQFWNHKVKAAQQELDIFETQINLLKSIRKQKSNALQKKLFSEYSFLNHKNEKKSLGKIFDNNPPAGAGECAAPKLLQYAFKNNLKPIAMAEFWWGQSPNSEIRKHKHFYTACISKCYPILMNHMLQGIEMEQNPFEINNASEKQIQILFSDKEIVVINKPTDLLSVPGKNIKDSVYQRIRQLYPDATGSIIVHRLDMATSGIMVIAKNEQAHKLLQRQFIKRTIKKRYIALLDGIVLENEGSISLPLRVDLNDRPRQLVCFEHGKKAQTHWEKIEVKNNKTKVYFYPITGRTHQLRVHAAHQLGLKTPIFGDDLYGKKADRLYLHAEELTFTHPISKNEMKFSVAANF
ncbi:MAG TPA: RNA pseudouridine synthase [Flavobacterium sp.]|nr:RNA pseudouridine synthase [Flavobacterium sp.]